ncbi:MAG: allantoicase [Myxococcales bacterium]|nr:allantoicase [Myxococcales bacterium]
MSESRPTSGGFTDLVDFAAERLGGAVLYATDDFFAEKENLLKPGRGVFIPDKYTDRGKWMDGWESRRKRTPGHDWCVIRLGLSGVIRGVDIDTNHFTGNYPEHASLEACEVLGEASLEELLAEAQQWTEILPIVRLAGGSQNLFPIAHPRRVTHLRFHIHPDGGVARLRVHGEVAVDPARLAAGEMLDLAALENGGVVVACNDMFFGPKDNLILPGPSLNMGDGWETRRKRGPGNDWVIVRLGAPGRLAKVVIDTMHFKGNFPDRCSLEGARLPRDLPADYLPSRAIEWQSILPETRLRADCEHVFEAGALHGLAAGPFTHVRLNVFPDGGVARLRLWGTPA